MIEDMGMCCNMHDRLYPERQKISRLFTLLVQDGYRACRTCGLMFQTENVHCRCCGSRLSITPTKTGKKSDNIKLQLEAIQRY